MNRDHTHKGMLAQLARGVGWLGLIALFACGLLCPASAQNTNRAQKVPPQQPQKQKREIEVEKKNNEMAMMLRPGSLKGKLFAYEDDVSSFLKDHICESSLPFPGSEPSMLILSDSTGKNVAHGLLNRGVGFCTFDLEAVPAGTYNLSLRSKVYYVINYSRSEHPFSICSSNSSNSDQDQCKEKKETIVTIQPGKVSAISLTGAYCGVGDWWPFRRPKPKP